jgi:hypothetical protein
VIIDESVEVAKRYGGTESGAFVNGVLDRIADGCGRTNEPKGKGTKALLAPEAPEPDSPLEEGFDPGEPLEPTASPAGSNDEP